MYNLRGPLREACSTAITGLSRRNQLVYKMFAVGLQDYPISSHIFIPTNLRDKRDIDRVPRLAFASI